MVLSATLEAYLFGVSTTDPATYVAVGILLALAALLACYVPARRVGRLDPAEVLKAG